MNLSEKAAVLRKLHHQPQPLVFVNAWDGASARIIESLNFPAVATTSAGVAYVAGFPDGQAISRDVMLAHVATIAGAVALPVTADLEGGYGPTVADAVMTVRGAIDAGAVGMNFEDSTSADAPLLTVAAQCARIAAMRSAANERGVPFVINARTDVYRIRASEEEQFAETIARAKAYLEAGADCIFVPFIAEESLIGRLAAAIPGPMNVLAGATTPDVATLTRLGVRRISLGSAPAAHVLAEFRRAALEVRDEGTYRFAADRITHAELNDLLEPRA
ncbi:MAG TPA: isocitrate lyase/phosphoenolpyruvate mutase family protein [Candidatus Lustribacter sp.]|jgi:2-methylisocitrate lyase-like PEP mutase family enzyme|nr:isocitrate lyase/phosphoenolpyruvate mutase family protein [Candidatus Lustribacter sp.]